MLLTTPTTSLEATLASNPVVPLTWLAEWLSQTLAGVQVGSSGKTGQLIDTSNVELIKAPPAQLELMVLSLVISNPNATPTTVTVNLNNGGTRVPWNKVILQPLDTLYYRSDRGFFVVDANGNARGVVPLPFGAAEESGGNLELTATATSQMMSLMVKEQQTLEAILEQLNHIARQVNAPITLLS